MNGQRAAEIADAEIVDEESLVEDCDRRLNESDHKRLNRRKFANERAKCDKNCRRCIIGVRNTANIAHMPKNICVQKNAFNTNICVRFALTLVVQRRIA